MHDQLTAAVQDPARLTALRNLHLLDTPPEEAFDRLTRLAALITDAPIAVVSLVDDARQYAKSCLLPDEWPEERSAPMEDSFCKYAVVSREMVLIEDAREDSRVASSAFVTQLGVLAYAGVPLITSEGHALGTLCVADLRVRRWSAAEISGLCDLAAVAITEIETRGYALRRARAAELLALEKETLELVARGDSLSQVLENLVFQVEELCDEARCAVLLLDEERRTLNVGAAPHLPEAYCRAMQDLQIGEGQGGCGTAAHRGEPVIVADLRNDPLWEGFRGVAETCGFQASWSFPIRGAHGAILGIFSMYSSAPRAPRASEQELAARVLPVAAIALERARSEAARRESEERFEELITTIRDVFWMFSPDFRETVYISPAYEQIWGRPAEALIQDPTAFLEGVHPEDTPLLLAAMEQVSRREVESVEYRVIRPDGSVRWVRSRGYPVCDDEGTVCRVVGITEDITAAKELEQEREKSRNFLESLVAASPGVVFEVDLRSGYNTYVSPAIERLTGYTPAEITAQHWFGMAHVHPDDAERIRTGYVQLRRPENSDRRIQHEQEYRLRCKDGTYRWFQDTMLLDCDGDGQPIRAIGFTLDIQGRKEAEQALRESEARFRAMFDRSGVGILLVDREGRVLMANPALRRMLGYSGRELRRRRFADFTHPDDVAESLALFEQAMAGSRDHYRLEKRYIRNGGEKFWADLTVSVVRADDGTPQYAIAMIASTTERRRAEAQRSAAVEHYRRLVETSPMGIYALNEEGLCTEINPVLARMLGRPVSELLGRHFSTILASAEDKNRAEASFQQKISGAQDHTEIELEIDTVSGRRRVQVRSTTIRQEGEIVGTHGVVQDITDSRFLEDALRQAQKMEAVGRLAGGIAHDINNVLTVIKGNSQLLLLDLPQGHAMREEIGEIDAAANRARDLTRQLLAFSRKQVLKPQVIDLNEIVNGMAGMLRRLIGEDIQVITTLDAQLGSTRVGPRQMEQVVTNLVVNARDAMPDGGTLQIQTRNVEIKADGPREHAFLRPAEYVELRVEDSGQGIDPEVMTHIFEPFFTTKPSGQGTGLGLSTVYGIVKQSDGYVLVESDEGKGTIFRILLPRIGSAPDQKSVEVSKEKISGGRETILLTEDEDSVRVLARRILERQGYTVLEARDGEEAIQLLQQHGRPIDLLLTDIVMPRMKGTVLAERITALQPGVPVLYMSGYPNGRAGEEGWAEGMDLVQKPYAPQTLLDRVREMLDTKAAGTSKAALRFGSGASG